MFLRCNRRVKDGKVHDYWNVVENRRLSDGRVVQRQVLYLGEINSSQREAWRKTIEVHSEGTRRQVALFPAGSMPADDVDAISVRLSELRIERVNVNSTRTGFLRAVERMGAHVAVEDVRESLGEPMGTLLPTPDTQHLTPVSVEPHEVPSMVDEIPLLACIASRAEGTSIFKGVGELRVKESDRLALVAKNLVTLGVRAHTEGDTLWVEGTDRPPVGRVETAGDHRLAMSFAVLGTLKEARVTVDDRDCVAISYPAFFTDLRRILRRA